jgi:hypothetical protein
MHQYRRLKFRIYKARQAWRKRRRLLFPSPAEVELIRIMGGKYIVLGWVKDPRTGFPFTLIWDLGTILKREGIQREVRAGAMYLDFATVGLRYRRGIEVDGLLFHRDITIEQERDEYVAKYGYKLLHVQAAEIYREPARVQQRILNFLAS